jgi:hypothetical protein
MADRDDGTVTVRVEVIVGGKPAPVRIMAGRRQQQLDLPFVQIVRPTSYPPYATPVRQAGGVNYISAGGQSSGISEVRGKVYDISINPAQSQYASPPTTGYIEGTYYLEGSWSFIPANNNDLPVVNCDNGRQNNNILIVWGNCGSYWTNDFTEFYAGCSGSSSPGIGGVPVVALQLPVSTLRASFTGALAKLGTVCLEWNGAAWVGKSENGAAAVTFLCFEPDCHLMSSGPATAFAVSGPPDSLKPFHWSAVGMALGEFSGRFKITITE